MRANTALKNKKKKHALKMEQKKQDKTYRQGMDDTCRFYLLLTYAVLNIEFGFGKKRLDRFKNKIDHYSHLVENDYLDMPTMMKVLNDHHIDVTKIGRFRAGEETK